MIGLLTAIYGLGWVPTNVWILLAWVAAAVVVGLFVGRTIRRRDMQVCRLCHHRRNGSTTGSRNGPRRTTDSAARPV